MFGRLGKIRTIQIASTHFDWNGISVIHCAWLEPIDVTVVPTIVVLASILWSELSFRLKQQRACTVDPLAFGGAEVVP